MGSSNIIIKLFCSGIIKLDSASEVYTNPKKAASMTNKRNQYTREFKLETISLVVDHKRKITDVVDDLRIDKSTLQKCLSQYCQEMNGQAPTIGNALTDKQRELQELRKQIKRLTME